MAKYVAAGNGSIVFAYYVLTLVLLETVSPKMYGNDYFVDLKFVFVLGSYKRRLTTVGGKTSKTSVVPGFNKIEQGGGSRRHAALLWWSYHFARRATVQDVNFFAI